MTILEIILSIIVVLLALAVISLLRTLLDVYRIVSEEGGTEDRYFYYDHYKHYTFKRINKPENF